MKATLEYNLPEEDHEFKTACAGKDYACALWDIKSFIRQQLKYGITLTDEQLLENIRDLIPSELE